MQDESGLHPGGRRGGGGPCKSTCFNVKKNSLQLTYARVDYDTFCTFLSEEFEKIPEHGNYSPELHTALVNIAGLVVIPFDEQYVYDYDGPFELTADPPMHTWGQYDEAKCKKAYDRGCEMLPKMVGENGVRDKEIPQLLEEFENKSAFDMVKLWGRHQIGFECQGKKKRKIHDNDKEAEIPLSRESDGSSVKIAFVASTLDCDKAHARNAPREGGCLSRRARGSTESSVSKIRLTEAPSTSAAASSTFAPVAPSTSAASSSTNTSFPEPSEEEVDRITKHYSRPGREQMPLPQNSNVVLGHFVSSKNYFVAYCKLCRTWFDWPPPVGNTKLNFGRPCEHASYRRR